MEEQTVQLTIADIVQDRTYHIRGQRVMLDVDIADMFDVDTKKIRLTVARNPKRFPPDFIFVLTATEWNELKKQIEPGTRLPAKQIPYAFTEAGVLMLSGRIKSEAAVKVSIQLIDMLFALSRHI